MKKTLATLIALFTLLATSYAASGDALSVMNSFIATFAKDNAAWKTDIVAITDPTLVPSGRQLGYSTVMGYYTFVPKTFGQLTEIEKQAVYTDPRLKAFIISLRNYNNYPAITNTDTPKPAFGVFPVEGVQPQPAGYYYPQPTYGTPYYTPSQMTPAMAIQQPITGSLPPQPQVSKVTVSPEEMLMDRPVRIYMPNHQ